MKLTHVRIKDLRSFSGEHELDVSSGVNYIVGPNNSGKSNLIRALELALDPEALYSPERDRPNRDSALLGPPPVTRITLTFQAGSTSPESTLLRRAQDYELAVRKARNASTRGSVRTYAADREVRFVTTFAASGARQTSFQAKSFGAASLPVHSTEHVKLEGQFRSLVRFAVIHSGQDLESLLKGKFLEILQLVISDHLSEEVVKVEAARANYLSALQTQLLEPLRGLIQKRVGGMFPEISNAELIPAVPSVDDTLASVEIQLGDAVTTPLSEKGTGIRGAVLVSMLQYLAEQSKRSLVLAVEEPEAFLHPAAQEGIKHQLEDLATRTDVSLLVTTHSPYVISRDSTSRISELRKRPDGFTEKAASVRGDEKRAPLLGSLYRDAGLAHVLERSLEIPAGTELVIVTEGFTDGRFIAQCCNAAGRPELVAGFHFIPAGKAANVVPQALLAEAATDVPVIALLDYDDNGRAAADKLKSFHWEPARRLLSLNKWEHSCANHDIEIEDLLPRDAVEKLVKKLGEDVALDSKERCGDHWHLRVSKSWKELAIESLENTLGTDAGGMIWLASELRSRAASIRTRKAAAAKAAEAATT